MTVNADLIIRHAAVRTDTSSCGGRMSKYVVIEPAAPPTPPATPPVEDPSAQNYIRDWTLAERKSGGQQLRKFFLHVVAPEGLADAGVFLLGPTKADDRVTLFAGTPSDTVGTLAASPTEYGAGALQSAVAAGATSFAVVMEAALPVLFRTGDTISLWQDAENEERHGNISASVSGSVVTITLAEGDMVAHDFEAGTAVCSRLPLGNIKAAVGTPELTTVAGTLDAAQITASALSAIDQTVTLTFTSPTAFSAVSDVKGSLGTGSIGAAFAPVNPDFTAPYFTIPAAAWGGTWVAGQVVRFAVDASAAAFWLRGVLPAGAGGTAGVSGADRFALYPHGSGF